MPDLLKVQLRTFRRAAGLTQEDLAHLLGLSVHSNVSRFERMVREPDIRTAFACEYALGAPAKALFANLFAHATRVVSDRARTRLDGLAHLSHQPAHAHRLTHLSQLAAPQRSLFDA